LEYSVIDFPAAELVDLTGTRIHFAIRERQRKIGREYALQRSHVCVKKCFARIALELEHVLFIGGLRGRESAGHNRHESNNCRGLHIPPLPIGSVRRSSLSPKSSRRQ